MNDLTMLESSLLWELLRGPRPNKHLNPPPLNFNDEQRQRVAMLFGTFAAQLTQKLLGAPLPANSSQSPASSSPQPLQLIDQTDENDYLN